MGTAGNTVSEIDPSEGAGVGDFSGTAAVVALLVGLYVCQVRGPLA